MSQQVLPSIAFQSKNGEEEIELSRRMALNLPPNSAEEYLYRVQKQAEAMPLVIESTVNPRDYDSKQTPNMPNMPEINLQYSTDRLDISLSPLEDWERRLLSDFADLRQYICRWQSLLCANKREFEVPKLRQEEEWERFFWGANNQTIADSTIVEEEKFGHPPTVKLLLQFDQILTRRLLEYQAHWLDEIQLVSRSRALWIYALLSRLDKPIASDEAAILRQILRRCCNLRDSIAQKDILKLKSINIIICIIHHFFGQ